MDKDIFALVSLGKIQTNRLTKDIVWNSIFISDYVNRYGIRASVVCDYAYGYLDFLKEVFEEVIDPNDIDTFWAVFDKNVRNNRGGYSFYDYTNYVVCVE